jgi:WD40 repeat protein
MRSEFIGDCMEFPGLPEAINRGQYLVPRMTRDELRRAITGPVEVSGARISPRLVARLLNDVEDDQDQLPVLQHALMRMWSHLWLPTGGGGSLLDLEHYEAIGTLGETLSRHAESTYQRLPSDRDRAIAERLFKALTDIDRAGRGIRRPVQVKEVCALAGADEAAVVEVIEHFRLLGRSFLMPPPNVPLDGDSVVDLSHESLMRTWARLRNWAREEAESAAVYRRLSQAAALAAAGQGSLWRRPELDIGLYWREKERPTAAWARRYDPEFGRAIAFLDRSRRRRLTQRVAASLAGLALAAVAFGYFYVQGVRAEQQALLRAVLGERDPLVQALLLAELGDSVDLDWGLEVAQQVASAAIPKAVLRGASDEAPLGVAFSADDARVATVAAGGALDWWRSDGRGRPAGGVLLHSPSGGDPAPELTAVAFSADGRTLAAGFADGSAALVATDPAAAGRPRALARREPASAIRSLAFSPDGRRIAAGYDDYGVEIRDLDGRSRTVAGPAERKHRGQVSGVAFAPDGETVVTASWDGTARIWDARTGGFRTVLCLARPCDETENPALRGAAFSPDGRWVIGASGDGSVPIWRSDGLGEPIVLARPGASAKHASFSPDGLGVVASFDDRTAQVWTLRSTADGGLESAGAPTTLGGHAGPVTAAHFNHSGNVIVTISDDGDARIWPVEPGEPRILGRHAAGVESVAFSADGTRVVSASRDGSARVWTLDRSSPPLVLDGDRGHGDWVRSAEFNPTATQVLTASEDSTFRLWDLAAGRMQVFPERAAVLGAAFDAAGARVVTATKRKAARIWALEDAGEPGPAAELTGHTDWVWSAAFSADGGRVVTASRDRTARIWKLPEATQAAVLEGHGDQVLSAAFSPDGGRVATASADGTARVWSTPGTAAPILLRHEGWVYDAAFSADGRWVVTASEDGTARIWSANLGIPRLVLRHGNPVRSAAFTPRPAGDRGEPTHVASGSEDGTVRLWRVSSSALVEYAANASTACLTADQRVRYLAESEARARRRAAQCERRFDREPAATSRPPGSRETDRPD